MWVRPMYLKPACLESSFKLGKEVVARRESSDKEDGLGLINILIYLEQGM